MHLPEFIIKLSKSSPHNQQWVATLPKTINYLTTRWKLKLGDPYVENVSCSFVTPCIYQKNPAVLKIGLPHEEALHEADALQVLGGLPTVHLLAYDKEHNALLLEKCSPGYSLKQEIPEVQDEIVCQVLKEIWKKQYPIQTFRPLASMVALWNKETMEGISKFPNPQLAKEGCILKRKLIKTSQQEALLATDLHAGNILKAQRSTWLAIDLKPYIGDPAYDLTQHILNNLERLGKDPIGFINRLAQLSGIDYQRLRDWTFARLASENNGQYQTLTKRF